MKSKAKSLWDREPKRPDVDPADHIWLNYRYGAMLDRLLESAIMQTWLWHSYDYEKTAKTLDVTIEDIQNVVFKIYNPNPLRQTREPTKPKKRGRPLKRRIARASESE